MSSYCILHIKEAWELKTKSGDKLMKSGNYKEALEFYKEALYRAEVLNLHTYACRSIKVSFMSLLVSSFKNIIHIYERMNCIEQAEEMMKKMIAYIIKLFKNKEITEQEYQTEIKVALVSYTDFINKYQLK